ncbi:MAG: 2,3-epoxybenzoyl-CoA dihydrolase [Polyangiaceae bacterium]
MAAPETASVAPIDFSTHPSKYIHWKLQFPETAPGGKGSVAELWLDIQEDKGLREGYPLKLNSYDLGVDIELADALMRIRFEHPEVKALVFRSGKDRIFCSGANIYMLGSSSHAFKVNFCKFTNETRLYIEDMSEATGLPSLAALNGTASGGGYELAIACDEIVLQEDGNSAVSYPETPLLGVLPGTGGLTRLVDKRKVRRDRADAFSSLAEGLRGKRAKEWGLVDAAPPKTQFEAEVQKRVAALVANAKRKPMAKVTLPAIEAKRTNEAVTYKYVTLTFDAANGGRTATLTVRAPSDDEPKTPEELAKRGAEAWAIRAFRELDDALLELRFNRLGTGVVAVKTEGDPKNVLAVDEMLAKYKDDGLVWETTQLMKRVLKRMDLTAKSFFALVVPGSAFAGSLLELALASDRVYMLDSEDAEVAIWPSPLNGGAFPMSNGLSRLESRFLADPPATGRFLEQKGPIDTKLADKLGIVTFAPDDIDWDDEIRIAFEERASLSPDALTGMEANLRFAGPETMETKIFARLSAWQNWIFQRPNAVGERGALTMYGKPERPEFSFLRT